MVPEPYFVSRGRSYQVKLGTRVTFHCEVSRDVSSRGHHQMSLAVVTAKLDAWGHL